MRRFNRVEEIVQRHEDAVIMSIAVLCLIEQLVVMPYNVDSLGNSRRPDLPYNFIKANGSHVVDIVTIGNFRCELDEFVLEPGWA